MLLQSHSRALLAVTLFLTVSALFLIYRTRYLRESGYGYRLHAIQGGEDFPGGIGNETLGVGRFLCLFHCEIDMVMKWNHSSKLQIMESY